MLKVTLKRGRAGKRRDQLRVLDSLGLKKVNQSVVKPDDPVFRGMISKVAHLVETEEVDGQVSDPLAG